MSGDTASCGCCTGPAVRTPGVIANRPGLAEIAYRSGTHSDFLATMLARLSSTDHPALSGLRTRDPDDVTIALLDAWAVACDVLTFYSERLANESYLRTATERTSLAELGKLVAYRLSPGVAAETWLAFALERPPVLPVPDPPDPGQVPPGVPAAVSLPVGLRVQSVPGPGEKPQTFETVEEIEARPEWNALPVVRTKPHAPAFGRVDAWLAGVGLNLTRGDALLFAGPDLANDHWDLRLVTDVQPDPAAGFTYVHWDHGLGSFNPPNQPAVAPETLVLRKRLAVFGHNAPVWRSMDSSFRGGYELVHPFPAGTQDKDKVEWPGFRSFTTSGADLVVDLDGAHADVVQGSWVVVSQDGPGFYRELYRVRSRAELSRAEFGISGKVTRLVLSGEAHTFGTPREVTVFAVGDPLTVVEAPDDSLVGGSTVDVQGDATAMSEGRSVVLAGTAADGTAVSEVLRVVTAVPSPPGRTRITFAEPPTQEYVRSTAAVLGNVVHATHGETVTQVLGSGDARRPFQTFALQQGPLTFVPDDSTRGAASTLRVEVDGVRWHERESAYGAGPADRIFTTRDEPSGAESVVFGDGHFGARPSSGSNNVRATYRKGLGADGNLARGQLSQALDRPLGVKGVSNPLPATGGVDPERSGAARRSIPLGVRTLGRAVSLQDFADFALAFSGIGKASATVLPLRGGRTVVVSVGDLEGLPAAARTVERLQEAIVAKCDPTVRVQVLPLVPGAFRISLKLATDRDRRREDVVAAVEAAVRTAYAPPGRSLGAPVHASALTALVASVPGVVAVDLDLLYRDGASGSLDDRLVAAPARVVGGTAVAAELLALAAGPFDDLGVMS